MSAGRSRTSRRWALAVVAASLGLVLAGCGGGADGAPHPTVSTAAAASSAGPPCAQTVQNKLRNAARARTADETFDREASPPCSSAR
jgi:hypothetical protein